MVPGPHGLCRQLGQPDEPATESPQARRSTKRRNARMWGSGGERGGIGAAPRTGACMLWTLVLKSIAMRAAVEGAGLALGWMVGGWWVMWVMVGDWW